MQKTLLTIFGLLSAGLVTAALALLMSLSQNGAPPGFQPPDQTYPGPNVTFSPTDEPVNRQSPTGRIPSVQDSYTLVVQGDGASSAITDRRTTVLFSQTELTALWQEMYPDQTTAPVVPQVDFTSNAVIAAFAGTQSTGGSGLSIASVQELEESTLVTFTLTVPGENCIATQVITQPFILISLPNTGAEFRTQILQETTVCN